MSQSRPKYWNKAKNYLSKKDKIIKALIKKYNVKCFSKRQIFFDTAANETPNPKV